MSHFLAGALVTLPYSGPRLLQLFAWLQRRGLETWLTSPRNVDDTSKVVT